MNQPGAKPVYGIDFGTTNTVILDPDFNLVGGDVQPTVVVLDPLGDAQSKASTPHRKPGFVDAGRSAWNDRVEWLNEGYHVIRSIKTFLDGNHCWRVEDPGRPQPVIWEPRDVVEAFLIHLQQVVADDPLARHTLECAVFTLPNGTSAHRRRVLRAAAEAVGIEVAGFVSESTAALLANVNALQQREYVAVFDWGGGTLDLSVLQLDHPRVIELGIAGYAKAGDEVDRRLARFAFEHRTTADQPDAVSWDALGERARQQWLMHIEEAKLRLSGGDEETTLYEELDGASPATGGVEVEMTLTRAHLASVCGPMVEEAARALATAVRDAGVAAAELSHVVVVGGSSNLPGVEEAIQRHFPDALVQWPPGVLPERAVATGAARAGAAGSRYELADHVEALLGGGGRIPLARPGDWWGVPRVRSRLTLIEESTLAQLPVVTRRDDPAAPDTYAGCVCTQTLGFDRERLQLEAQTTADMTVRISLGSADGIAHDAGVLELDRLRFAYVLP